MFWSFLYLILGHVLRLLLLLVRGERSKELEILTLRPQVAVLGRQVHRPDLGDGDRVLLAALSRLLSRPSWEMFFMTPATLLRLAPGELDLGLSADQRRTRRGRNQGAARYRA